MNYLPRPEGPTPDDFRLSRRAVGGLFFTGYAVAALGAEAAPITTPSDGLVVDEITIPNGEARPLPAYVARPEGKAKHGAIIVVNEIFGIHDYIKDVCRRWAREGYVAIAPDYFHRAGNPAGMTDFAEIRKIVATAHHAQVMGDTATTLGWLKQQAFVDAEKLGITGFCWGGTVVWMAAARFPEIGAGAAFYGRLVPPPPPEPGKPPQGEPNRPYPVDVAGQLKHAPVLGLYGALDKGIPVETVERMRAALKAAGDTTSEIVVYPDADHGFHADYRPSYNAEAAADAWKRAVAWFRKHL